MRFMLFVLIIATGMTNLYAESPNQTCPAGYMAVKNNDMLLANGPCPDGYKDVGTVTSCLVASPDGTCAMFVPADSTYTDEIGTYRHTNICPLS